MKKCVSLIVILSILLSMMSYGGVSVPAATYYLGDVNGDGNVSTLDARMLLSLIVSGTQMTLSQQSAADMNGDSAVNTSDVKLILDKVMNVTMGDLSSADLLAPSLDHWHNPVQQVGTVYCTVKQRDASGGGYVFTNVTERDEGTAGTMLNPFTWPYTSYSYTEKLLLPSSAAITYDITVDCSSASLNLYLGGDLPHFDDKNAPNFIPLNTFITSNIDAGSGDMLPGTYSGTISVATILASGKVPSECVVNGSLWVSGVKLYIAGTNDQSVTIRKLSVNAAYHSEADVVMSTDPMEAVRSYYVLSDEIDGLDTITGLELYENGVRSAANNYFDFYADNKKIYHTLGKNRVFNYTDGYQIDIPSDWEEDFSLSELRSRFSSDTCVLTVSKEEESPYGNTSDGWETYMTEWLLPYVSNESFLSENYMRYLREPIISEYIVSGFTVMTYDIAIDWQGQIKMPYYSIAVIRKFYTYDTFYLMVLKSSAPTDGMMDRLLRSFKENSAFGTAVNSQQQYNRVIPQNWNDETKAYYNKLVTQNTTDWGFFSYSMVENSSADYDTQFRKIDEEKNRLTQAIGEDYGIMPTYTHLAYGNYLNSFPTDMANHFAGGNGFNGKPVLQFTYQYTLSNNTNLAGPTPVFNVMRGDYDSHFRQLARDIKAYGKPVLFRLNNEMNTDWTSYSGIVSLLDPDIFIKGWQKLYNIFEQEGVDNCIWIFNPFTPTAPYCSWGDTLCYMPGEEYVQILGLTNYEMGNGSSVDSFYNMYTEVYNESKDNFINLPWVISEFACGAGGEKQYNWSYDYWQSTTLGRNRSLQASWITNMFYYLNNRNSYAFCKNIKGAVWFNCNDYTSINNTDYILNYLELDEQATSSLRAFRNGLAGS